MNFARVIGTLWATRKDESLEGAKLQVIQPLTGEMTPLGRPLVACDTVGAGPGELVLYVTAYEAAIPWIFRPGSTGPLAALDASIVAIVERHDRVDDWKPAAATKPAPKATAAAPTKTRRKKR